MTGTVVRRMMMTTTTIVVVVAFHDSGPCVTHVVQELDGQFHLPRIIVVVVVTPLLVDKWAIVRKQTKRTHMKHNMKEERCQE